MTLRDRIVLRNAIALSGTTWLKIGSFTGSWVVAFGKHEICYGVKFVDQHI
ncbi:MAG TPA: hypothetical protein V6C91_03310 [Coleofasciculaceae cyanobacterium]